MVAPLALAVSLVVGSRPSGLDASLVPASSGWPALPPTALAQQPAPVTAARVGVGLGVEPQGVGAGVGATGADGQPVQVVGPAGLVGGDLAGGEVAVGETEQGAATLWDQVDLDHAGAGGKGTVLDVPAPAEHDPPGRVDLQEAPRGPAVAADVHAEHPAQARVELGLQPLSLIHI